MEGIFIVLCVFLVHFGATQRVAPGVPPQHYQQPPAPQYQQQQQQQPPQQYQQQQQQIHQQQQQIPVQHQQVHQQQQQHVPMQQQQVPVQHQQVPVQQQQVPHQQGHQHGQPGQILNAANMQHEKEHMAEHFDVPMDTSKMSEQELQFHYFKMHDADNNNKLDGCELIKSLIHWHDPEDKDGQQKQVSLGDEQLVEVLDPLFTSMDANNDGYIDYTEYIKHTADSGSANV